MIIAGEPSGDLHGASLIKELRKKNSSLIITGIGGDLMAQAGMKLFFHIKDLSVMGVTEVIMQFNRIKQAFDLFREKIDPPKPYYQHYQPKHGQAEFQQEKPDLLILIDYPGFNLKAAAHAKKRDIPVLYYITPKVWAWNRSRLKKIKQYIDHAALIFPFEEAIFQKAKIPATFVGNPLLDYYNPNYYISKDTTSTTTIGLLPGSRESEIYNLLEMMLQSAILTYNKLILQNNRHGCEKQNSQHQVTFLVSAASSININKFNKILKQYNQVNIKPCNQNNINISEYENIFEVVHGEPTELFRRCDLLIAASGTVTLEAAICGVPMVIVYKTSPLTYFLAKTFVKIPYVGLPNIIAKYQIVPELLQHDATPQKISEQVLSMLNPANLASTRKRLLMMTQYILGGAGASARTAKIAVQMIQRK